MIFAWLELEKERTCDQHSIYICWNLNFCPILCWDQNTNNVWQTILRMLTKFKVLIIHLFHGGSTEYDDQQTCTELTMGWALCQIFYLDYFIQSSEQLFFFLLNIFYWLCYYSSNFFPFVPFHPVPPFPPAILPLSSYPWVMHISSLATSLHILFLTSLYFVPTNLCFLIN